MDWNRVQAKSAQQDSFASGVGQGVWDGGKAMATDVADVSKAAYKVATDDAYREQAFAKASEIAQATGQFGAKAVKDPIGTGESVWNQAKAAAGQAKKAFVEARDTAEKEGRLNNFYGSLLGRGGFEIAAMFFPVSKLGMLGKGAKVGSSVGKATRVGKVIGKTGKLRAGERLNRRKRQLKALTKAKPGLVATCAETKAATLAGLHEKYAPRIQSMKTFKTHGVPLEEARRYLKGAEGKQYLKALEKSMKAADPKEPVDMAIVRRRALGQVMSGKNLPKPTTSKKLVKIVAEGSVKDAKARKGLESSVFWTSQDELDKAVASGRPLNEVFGLPMKSDAIVYEIYEATPKSGGGKVYSSVVARTTELDGLEKRSGGAIQYLAPDRADWTVEKTARTVRNVGGYK